MIRSVIALTVNSAALGIKSCAVAGVALDSIDLTVLAITNYTYMSASRKENKISGLRSVITTRIVSIALIFKILIPAWAVYITPDSLL